MWKSIYISLFIFITIIISCYCIDNPEEIVNWLAGSFTDGNHFSTGNTLPLITMPGGFNNWSPQTKDGNKHTGSWWFQGNEHKLTWLRCTHQPSPWIGDYGWFLFSPQISQTANRNPVHFWEPRGANIKPHIFDATVAPFNIQMELTPTVHGAIARFTFPSVSSGIYDAGDMRVCYVEGGWTDSGQGDSWGTPTPYIKGVARQV